METFNIPYQQVYQFQSSWNTTVTDLSSGKEQRIANWDSPRRGWEIVMEKTLEIIEQARVFFDARKGRYEAFWFIPPHSDTPVKVRFDTDDFKASITYSAGTFTLKVIEVL